MADFYKYHGLGNDYIVIDPARFPFDPTPAAVRAVCDRHYGAGSDGILLGPLAGLTDPDQLALRIFNPDGSEAEKSGNGLRIFSWFLYEHGFVEAAPFPLRTKGGPVVAQIIDPLAKVVQVDMGAPSFTGPGGGPIVDRDVEFGGERCRITFVSMGNPHCVVTGLPLSEALACRLGPVIERAPLFPAKTNVQFLQVLSRSEILIEIWERGAGYTLASGSSSCGAAAAARKLGLVDDEVTVHMPGGVLQVTFKGGTAHLVGPVEKVMEGTFADDLLARIRAGELV
ncbi:MAG: diaminopimelate epimerase [Holophaga sp.]|nr:diaminopimelate epimerase [Holophaga sp.]